ncbi:MAG: (2Fe-2S)-binding protein [Alphaproteobacteria bacterium]|jgi:carbon-monoxide dehydrogenase small subunit|nr:(2Fe-2S)-binding protein [Alphaproteobacteria bacterium]MDP6819117.1 (2Fe-2S)-binding protein [Alphaproteobacteria bacterium]
MTAKRVSLTVNGRGENIAADGLTTLQQVLREALDYNSVKDGCTQGSCGACSVLVDGELRIACLLPAGGLQGAEVTTLEGLNARNSTSVIQQSFVEHSAAQCGFCTSGMIVSAQALLDENPAPSRDEIMEAISGNMCRCTGYLPIVEAVASAARKLAKGDGA